MRQGMTGGAVHDGARLRLLERDAELAAVLGRVEAACAGEGSLVLVEGPAGIGKSALLEAARAGARARGVEVLSARGAEPGADVPFGLMRRLFERGLAGFSEDTRRDLLSGAAQPAAALLGDRDPHPRSSGPFAVLHGLYWLCVNLASEGPLALVLDDVHWADLASLRWLRFISSRLERLPVVAVVAARSGEPGTDHHVLEGLRLEPGIVHLEPRELSARAVGELVRSALSEEADEDLCAACHRATHGNPFLLSELLATLPAGDVPMGGSPIEGVLGLGTSGAAALALARLARLPDEARRLTRALAVLGGGCELATAARLADIDYEAANAAADSLVRCQLLSSHPKPSFVHPLVRASIYADLSRAERARAHGRAARLLAAEGAADDAVAPHWLLAEPAGDRWAVDWLRRAASHAAETGGARAATTYLRRALAEPPAGEDRPAVLLELGLAEAATSAPQAEEHLSAALEEARSPAQRAAVALHLGRLLVRSERAGRAIETFDRGIAAALQAGDRELALRLGADAITAATDSPDPSHRTAARADRLLGEVRSGETSPERLVLAAVAWERAVSASAPAQAVVELAERALASGELLALEGAEVPSLHVAVGALTLCDRLADAEAHFTDVLEEAGRARSASALALGSSLRSWAACRAGALTDAEAGARASLATAAAERGRSAGRPIALAVLVECLVARGQAGEAQEALQRWGEGSAIPDSAIAGPLLCARGHMRVLGGSPAAALEDFRACGRLYDAAGIRNPGMGPWRSCCGYVLATLGDMPEAHALVDEELEIARAFGAPRSLGLALRVAGTITHGRAGVGLLEEAVELLEGSEARLELANALYRLGEKAREQGHPREARHRLRSALDVAHRCGASMLAGRAHRALISAGGRARHRVVTGIAGLTPSQLQVARLAAEGLSNRAIAERQFLSLRMVETHLTRTFRKLEIASRAELPAALASGRTG